MEKKYISVPFNLESISQKKDGDNNFGLVKGLASTFDNVDSGHDRVLKGAFKNSLAKYKAKDRQIRMFYQHSSKNVIGGFDVFKENDKGLFVEGKINLDVQTGREAYSLAKQGVITDFSIGYWTIDSEWVKEKVGEKDGNDITMDIRNLKELDLAEISLVSNPMNEQATIDSIKSCKSITDISKFLKLRGLSNKETNEIIYFIKSTRNENDKPKSRNENLDKVDRIKLVNSIDDIISKIKKGF